jgi:hypothetical protein
MFLAKKADLMNGSPYKITPTHYISDLTSSIALIHYSGVADGSDKEVLEVG